MRPSDSSVVDSSAARYSASRFCRAQRLFGAIAQTRQQRLEIVGDIVGHFQPSRASALQCAQHGGIEEVFGEPVDLHYAGTCNRQPLARIAAMMLRVVSVIIDTAQHAARHEQTASRRAPARLRSTSGQSIDDDVIEPLAFVEIATDQQSGNRREALKHPRQRQMIISGWSGCSGTSRFRRAD